MSGNDIWTTVSSTTETVEDTNPAVWYEAAKNATTYESAMRLYNKAEYLYKNDKSGYISDWFLKERLYYKFHKRKIHVILCVIFVVIGVIGVSILKSEYDRMVAREEAKRIRAEEIRLSRERAEQRKQEQIRQEKERQRFEKEIQEKKRLELFNDILNDINRDVVYYAKIDFIGRNGSNYRHYREDCFVVDAKVENGERFLKVIGKETHVAHWLYLSAPGLWIDFNKKFKKLDDRTIQKSIDDLNSCEKVLFQYNDLAYSILENRRQNISNNEVNDIIKILNDTAEEAERLVNVHFKGKEANSIAISNIKDDLLSSYKHVNSACRDLANYYKDRIRYINNQVNENDRYYYGQFQIGSFSYYKNARERLNNRLSENRYQINSSKSNSNEAGKMNASNSSSNENKVPREARLTNIPKVIKPPK